MEGSPPRPLSRTERHPEKPIVPNAEREPANLGHKVPQRRHVIQIDIPLSRPNREKLRAALRDAVAGHGDGLWRVQVRPVLIYSKPSVGTWWWGLTLTSATGAVHSLLLGADRQTPATLVETVQMALGGKLVAVVCAGCGRVRVDGDLWVRRARARARSHTSHGICPDCMHALYPDLARRRAAKR